ncbi:MAG TPA: hypothetical protein VKB36_00515 [Vicinamibacterales bacterium]|nr:hypothetical protein [Vicinamibacterales bacterium]
MTRVRYSLISTTLHAPEGDAHPVATCRLRHARDRALDPNRLAG